MSPRIMYLSILIAALAIGVLSGVAALVRPRQVVPSLRPHLPSLTGRELDLIPARNRKADLDGIPRKLGVEPLSMDSVLKTARGGLRPTPVGAFFPCDPGRISPVRCLEGNGLGDWREFEESLPLLTGACQQVFCPLWTRRCPSDGEGAPPRR